MFPITFCIFLLVLHLLFFILDVLFVNRVLSPMIT